MPEYTLAEHLPERLREPGFFETLIVAIHKYSPVGLSSELYGFVQWLWTEAGYDKAMLDAIPMDDVERPARQQMLHIVAAQLDALRMRRGQVPLERLEP